MKIGKFQILELGLNGIALLGIYLASGLFLPESVAQIFPSLSLARRLVILVFVLYPIIILVMICQNKRWKKVLGVSYLIFFLYVWYCLESVLG